LPGTVALHTGTLTIADSVSVTASDFRQSDGTLAGGGTLSLSGSYRWSGGDQTDAGDTVLTLGATGTIDGTTDNLFLHGGRTLRNDGTLTWSGGFFGVYEGATIENGGLFDVTGDNFLA